VPWNWLVACLICYLVGQLDEKNNSIGVHEAWNVCVFLTKYVI
jgi:hypothetical protein